MGHFFQHKIIKQYNLVVNTSAYFKSLYTHNVFYRFHMAMIGTVTLFFLMLSNQLLSQFWFSQLSLALSTIELKIGFYVGVVHAEDLHGIVSISFQWICDILLSVKLARENSKRLSEIDSFGIHLQSIVINWMKLNEIQIIQMQLTSFCLVSFSKYIYVTQRMHVM